MTSSMDDVLIRPERPDEAEVVRTVELTAFGGRVEAGIVDALRDTDRWIDGGSLVAEHRGRVVGHLLLSEGDLVSTDGRTVRRIWMVGPVAVVPDHQGRGIGAALMREAIDFADARGQPVLCLLGHAGYYPRFGFEPARAIGIEPPRPWPDASWLARRLRTWDPSLQGIARFPEAFPDAQ